MSDVPVGLPPALLDQIVALVQGLFAQYAQSQSRGLSGGPSILRVGTVQSSDPTNGTVNVLLDDDLAGSSVSTLTAAGTPCVVVGVTPVIGGRALVEFAPGGAAFCVGTIGPGSLRLDPTVDVSLLSDGHPLQIGLTSALNVAFDENEMQYRNNGAASRGNINVSGGEVRLSPNFIVGVPPGGSSDTAHLANAALWAGASLLYGLALTADGRTILNYAGAANYTEIRGGGGTPSIARFQIGAGGAQGATNNGHSVLTLPADLAQISGGIGLVIGSVSGGPALQVGRPVTSSRRIKRDIKAADIDRLADAALALRPVTFRYTPEVLGDAAEEQHTGLIAEEVVEQIPDAGCWGPDPAEPPRAYEDGWEPPDDEPDAPHPDLAARPAHTDETLTLPKVIHDFQDRKVLTHLVALCQRQQAHIERLEGAIRALGGNP